MSTGSVAVVGRPLTRVVPVLVPFHARATPIQTGVAPSPELIAVFVVLLAVLFAAAGEVVRLLSGDQRFALLGGGSDGTTAAVADDVPDPSLLNDEEHVLWLLHQHDGRLKQSQIVDRTEWSKSKVSRVLSRMEADGRIEKVPVGRENLIAVRDGGQR